MSRFYKNPKLTNAPEVDFLQRHLLLVNAVLDKELTPIAQKILCVVLERYRGDLGYARCSTRLLAQVIGHDRKYVMQGLKRLIEAGYLTVIEGNIHLPNAYIPNPDKIKKTDIRELIYPESKATEAPGTPPWSPLGHQEESSRPPLAESSRPPQYVPSVPVKVIHIESTYRAVRPRKEDLEDITETETERPGSTAPELEDYNPDHEIASSERSKEPAPEPEWLSSLKLSSRHKGGFDVLDEIYKICDKLGIRKPEYKLRRARTKWIQYTNANPTYWPKTPIHAVSLLTKFIQRERW